MDTAMACFKNGKARETAVEKALSKDIHVLFSGEGTLYVLGNSEQNFPSQIVLFCVRDGSDMVNFMIWGASTCSRL